MSLSTGRSTDGTEGAAPAHLVLDLGEEDLIQLHAMASLDGVNDRDKAGMIAVAIRALRAGMLAQLDAAGLPRVPSIEEVEAAVRLEQEAGVVERVDEESQPLNRWSLRNVLGNRHVWVPLVAVLAVALVVSMIGGYAAGWTWTGFQSNDQLWDWLHLLLLPVAFGTFPLWLQYSGHMSSRRKRTLAVWLLTFAVLVLVGYVAPLLWTGFKGQTLWNWLILIVLPVTITMVRTWPQTSRKVVPAHVVVAAVLVAGWVVTLVGGYAAGWTWTGYANNTLWEWLQLLLAPIVVGTVVVPTMIRLVSGDVSRVASEAARQEKRQRMLEAARERWALTEEP